MDRAIELLQEVARDDLEACKTAIEADEKALALSNLERAFAKIDSAIDIMRSVPSA